jgi:putative ABC transport system permease protein
MRIHLFFRSRRNRELDDEIQAHLAMAARDRIERGEEPREAALAARREFGNPALIKETTRETWGWNWLEQLWQDARYAMRGMRRTPAFTAVAVLSIALGIGANTAIFSLIDALMLRWLPVSNPQELLLLKMQGMVDSFSYPIVRLLADQKEIFPNVAGFSGWIFKVGSAGSTGRVQGAMVTGGYYETLGLKPVIGRLLSREDDEPGAPLAAVLSYGYWTRQFGADASAIGGTIRLNGVPVTIVGISPPGFTGANVGSMADITMAAATIPLVSPESASLLGAGNFWLRALVRLRKEMPVAQARARLAVVWPRISESVIPSRWPPDQRKGIANASFEFSPGGTGWTRLREMFRKPLLALMGMVSLVLLIACANVAGLLLARGAARRKEIAVRLSIGAGRSRVMRQLLAESTLLSLIGAAFGLALAWILSRVLVNTMSNVRMQIAFDLTPNWHVLGFTSAVAIGTGLLFGLAPAFQITGAEPLTSLQPALKEDAGGRSRTHLRSSLVTAQVALALVLLILGGLFVRTFRNLQNVDPGFRREGVLIADLEGRRTTVPQELLEAVRRVPGIVSASLSTHTPLSGSTWSEPAVPAGQPLPERDNAHFIGTGPHFFDTMQIPLLAGREFTEHDVKTSPAVAIINEAFARRYYANRNPVGQHLAAKVRNQNTDLEIVGMAKNTSLRGLRVAPPPTVYVAYAQLTGDFPSSLEMRAAGSLGQVASAIQKELQARLPEAPAEVRALSAQVDATLVEERMMARLAGGFGTLSLILASIGLYGLLNYRVARRIKEIGIRMALGARRSRVIRMEIGSAVRLVALGIALGLPAAWAASDWVQSMLFGLTRADPATIAVSVILLTAAALMAAYLPARRASRVDPMAALRHE